MRANSVFHSGVNADTVKTLARLPVLVFYLVACWIVWKWTSERYSKSSALLAVTLIAACAGRTSPPAQPGVPAPTGPNTLTAAEDRAGWVLLFDGELDLQ